MKPVELFGVIVRTIGLLVAMGSLSSMCVHLISVVVGGPGSLGGLLLGIPGLFVGIYFLSGAELLVDSVYPKEP
jgi:hypothetical protein